MNELCPICNEPLNSVAGNQVNGKDGMTVWCPNLKCEMADWGHGKNLKYALVVFKQKCGKAVS